MNELKGKFEKLINIAIACSAMLLCSMLVKHYFADKKRSVTNDSLDLRVPAGTKIAMSDVRLSGERTLLLILSAKCRYCSERAAFYRRLVKWLDGRVFRLLSVR